MDVPEAPTGLSPSSLSLWEQCRRRFYNEKILRRDEGQVGVDAILGTYVHAVLEQLMELPAADRTFTAARDIMYAVWPTYRDGDSAEICAPDKETSKAFRRRALGSVRSYFNTENPKRVNVQATERRIEQTLGGVPVRGVVDRVDRDGFGDLVISDYKTGKIPPPWFRKEKFRQLNIYAGLVEAEDGELAAEGRLVFTTHAQVVTTPVSDDSVEAAIEDVVTAWDGIHEALEAEDFPPRPGPLCGWCPFAAECPEGLADLRVRVAQGKLRADAPAFPLVAS